MTGEGEARAPGSDPALFDRYAAEYEAAIGRGLRFSGEDTEYFARERVRWLRGRLDQLAQGSAPVEVLDFGCGTGGAIPHLLAELGPRRVLGTDISDASRAVAEREHGSEAVQLAPPDAVAPEAFDLAHTNGVFHHIEPARRPAALAVIHAALRPGGVLAFWENNPWNPGTRLIMRAVEFDRDAQTLSARVARRLLAANGFEVLDTTFLFIFPRPLRALRPLEPRLARLPLGGQYLVLARKAR